MNFIEKWANKHCEHQDVPGTSFWVECDRPMVSANQLDAALATIDMLMLVENTGFENHDENVRALDLLARARGEA